MLEMSIKGNHGYNKQGFGQKRIHDKVNISDDARENVGTTSQVIVELRVMV